MYRSTHSSTSALDGGEWSASRPGQAELTPWSRVFLQNLTVTQLVKKYETNPQLTVLFS